MNVERADEIDIGPARKRRVMTVAGTDSLDVQLLKALGKNDQVGHAGIDSSPD